MNNNRFNNTRIYELITMMMIAAFLVFIFIKFLYY